MLALSDPCVLHYCMHHCSHLQVFLNLDSKRRTISPLTPPPLHSLAFLQGNDSFGKIFFFNTEQILDMKFQFECGLKNRKSKLKHIQLFQIEWALIVHLCPPPVLLHDAPVHGEKDYEAWWTLSTCTSHLMHTSRASVGLNPRGKHFCDIMSSWSSASDFFPKMADVSS